MAAKRKPLDYHAKLTVHDASKLTKVQMRGISDWLRKLARDFEYEYARHNNLATRFTARLMK